MPITQDEAVRSLCQQLADIINCKAQECCQQPSERKPPQCSKGKWLYLNKCIIHLEKLKYVGLVQERNSLCFTFISDEDLELQCNDLKDAEDKLNFIFENL